MNITVKFFAFKQLAGAAERVAALPEGATVAELAEWLLGQVPQLAPYSAEILYLANQQLAQRDQPLHEGDVVRLLKIVGGG